MELEAVSHFPSKFGCIPILPEIWWLKLTKIEWFSQRKWKTVSGMMNVLLIAASPCWTPTGASSLTRAHVGGKPSDQETENFKYNWVFTAGSKALRAVWGIWPIWMVQILLNCASWQRKALRARGAVCIMNDQPGHSKQRERVRTIEMESPSCSVFQ